MTGGGVSEWTGDIHEGDAAERLGEMPESSVHMAMCSPPYYGLRDYDVDGQIGLEDSLDEYIRSIVSVADELKRVLRDDGSWWLNLGDSFAGSWGAQSKDETSNNIPQHDFPDKNPGRNAALTRKSKMLVPHRVAIALEDAGWIVRADCPWVKPNPMPHPVDDRLHEHKEFIFHLTPEPDYWFDLDSVRQPHKECSIQRSSREDNRHEQTRRQSVANEETLNPDQFVHPNGKNPGDVFEVNVQAFPDAHFAVYPPELCEIPIKSSCPPSVCSDCGTPHRRDVEDVPVWEREPSSIDRPQLRRALVLYEQSDLTEKHLKAARSKGFSDAGAGKQQTGAGRNAEHVEMLAGEAKEVLGGYFREITMTSHRTTGWSKVCDCDSDQTDPGIVLDPFVGAGTTCLVAKELGRRFIGIDLNPEYVAMAQKRVGVDVDEPHHLRDSEATGLEAYIGDGGGPR